MSIVPYTITVTRGGPFPAEPLTWPVTGNSVDEALQAARDQIAGKHAQLAERSE